MESKIVIIFERRRIAGCAAHKYTTGQCSGDKIDQINHFYIPYSIANIIFISFILLNRLSIFNQPQCTRVIGRDKPDDDEQY